MGIRGSSDEEIQLWNECARLVTNAIVYQLQDISQLLTSFEYQEIPENRYRQTGSLWLAQH